MNAWGKPISLREKVYLLCVMIVTAAVMAVITALEIGIALHLGLVKSFFHLGMKAGSMLWILLAVAGWWSEFFDKKLRQISPHPTRTGVATVLVITACAACTQATIHWGRFISISNSANCAIAGFFLAFLLMLIAETWKQPVVD